MSLSARTVKQYKQILKEELIYAMGCTEPIAIAYAAAILRCVLGKEPTSIRIGLSGNIIKNVKSVIVPATGGMHGILATVAAGVVAACPEKKLEVLSVLRPEQRDEIVAFSERVDFSLYELNTCRQFDLVIEGRCDGEYARVKIEVRHTNVVLVERNGEDRTAKYLADEHIETDQTDRSCLNVADIVAFADTVSLDDLEELLERQLEFNMAIAKEGLKGEYSASIGQVLLARCQNGEDDVRIRARAYAAAGSDARMGGCELPVCILSGSGNQGITASVPIAVYAEHYRTDRERTLRALLVSDLITIHQKTGIGCLSAYCGAISAGCGCGCGICYLLGGGYYEIAHTLVNSVAVLSGTICDGAKASCAAKIAMAVEAGIMGYEMTMAHKQFYGGDGIVTKGVENTIKNVGRLARDGMSETDREIIRIMLEENVE
ncbi:MAG: serine dehydratase subunit alpha family protein [Clostridia bacterium]|nr:serine dehydratase subunit alpha family protein [Clostridia bacterium]